MIEVSERDIVPIAGPWRLPEGWQWRPLVDVVTIHDKARKPVEKGKRVPGIIPFCGANGVIDYVSGFTHEGDFVLIAEDGGFYGPGEKSAYAVEGKFWANNHVHVLKGRPDVLNNRWLLYVLIVLDLRSYLTGATRPKLTQENMKKIILPVPSQIETQHRILIRLDSLLTNLKEAQNTLDGMQQDINQVMESVLAEVFGPSTMKHWQNKARLGNRVSIRARPVDPRLPEYKQLPHIGGKSIESGTCRLGAYHTAEEDQVTGSKYLFDPGVVLYSKIRPYLRKVTLVDFKGLCSADIYPLSVTSEDLLPRFLMWSMVAPPFTEFANTKSERALMPKINRDELFSYELPFPTSTEQQYIVNYIDSVQKEEEKLQNMLRDDKETLRQVERVILNRAFQGEL